MANRDGEARTEEDDEREGNKPGNHELVIESGKRWRALMAGRPAGGQAAGEGRRARTPALTRD